MKKPPQNIVGAFSFYGLWGLTVKPRHGGWETRINIHMNVLPLEVYSNALEAHTSGDNRGSDTVLKITHSNIRSQSSGMGTGFYPSHSSIVLHRAIAAVDVEGSSHLSPEDIQHHYEVHVHVVP